MKAILISTRPQWVEKILNGIKKDEIRKGTAIGRAINKLIEEQGVAPMLIYCTKEKEILWRHNNLETFGKLSRDVEKQFCVYGKNGKELDDRLLDFLRENGIKENISRGVRAALLNGKVVARFNATAEHIEYETCSRDISGWWKDDGKMYNRTHTYLTYKEMFDYIGAGEGTVIHINDLEIFDKPKELNSFVSKIIVNKKEGITTKLYMQKAPQSWCYVEVQ